MSYVLIEPPRGVDVSARIGIWRIISQLGRDGAAIVLVSTDFDDISAVCNRCLVFSEGRISGKLVLSDLTPETVSAAAVAGTRPRTASATV